MMAWLPPERTAVLVSGRTKPFKYEFFSPLLHVQNFNPASLISSSSCISWKLSCAATYSELRWSRICTTERKQGLSACVFMVPMCKSLFQTSPLENHIRDTFFLRVLLRKLPIYTDDSSGRCWVNLAHCDVITIFIAPQLCGASQRTR